MTTRRELIATSKQLGADQRELELRASFARERAVEAQDRAIAHRMLTTGRCTRCAIDFDEDERVKYLSADLTIKLCEQCAERFEGQREALLKERL